MSTIEEIRRVTEERAKQIELENAKQEALRNEKAKVCAEPYMAAVHDTIRSAAQQGSFDVYFRQGHLDAVSQKTMFGKPVFNPGCSRDDIMDGIASKLTVEGYRAKRRRLSWNKLGKVILFSHQRNLEYLFSRE